MHCESCGIEIEIDLETSAEYPGLCAQCREGAEEEELARVQREETRRKLDTDTQYQKETGGP